MIRLNDEIVRLESEAKSEEDNFAAVWRIYGSELAGPPNSIHIKWNTAKELRRKLAYLELVKSGDVDTDDMLKLDEREKEITRQIDELHKEKVSVMLEKSKQQYLLSVIKN